MASSLRGQGRSLEKGESAPGQNAGGTSVGRGLLSPNPLPVPLTGSSSRETISWGEDHGSREGRSQAQGGCMLPPGLRDLTQPGPLDRPHDGDWLLQLVWPGRRSLFSGHSQRHTITTPKGRQRPTPGPAARENPEEPLAPHRALGSRAPRGQGDRLPVPRCPCASQHVWRGVRAPSAGTGGVQAGATEGPPLPEGLGRKGRARQSPPSRGPVTGKATTDRAAAREARGAPRASGRCAPPSRRRGATGPRRTILQPARQVHGPQTPRAAADQ